MQWEPAGWTGNASNNYDHLKQPPVKTALKIKLFQTIIASCIWYGNINAANITTFAMAINIQDEHECNLFKHHLGKIQHCDPWHFPNLT